MLCFLAMGIMLRSHTAATGEADRSNEVDEFAEVVLVEPCRACCLLRPVHIVAELVLGEPMLVLKAEFGGGVVGGCGHAS